MRNYTDWEDTDNDDDCLNESAANQLSEVNDLGVTNETQTSFGKFNIASIYLLYLSSSISF